MRKFILLTFMFVAAGMYGQDAMPAQPKVDSLSSIELKEGVSVSKSGTRYSKKTYTDIYEIVTDSIVYRFGLEFRYDSTLLRRVPMENCDRKVYDMMKVTTEKTILEQEKRRKETIEFFNRYRTSAEVWVLFKIYGLLK